MDAIFIFGDKFIMWMNFFGKNKEDMIDIFLMDGDDGFKEKKVH